MHKILCQETPEGFGRLHQKRQFKLLKTWSVFANPDLDVSQNRQPLFFENCHYTVNESSLKIGFIGVRLLMLRLDMVKPSQVTVTKHLPPVDYEQIFLGWGLNISLLQWLFKKKHLWPKIVSKKFRCSETLGLLPVQPLGEDTAPLHLGGRRYGCRKMGLHPGKLFDPMEIIYMGVSKNRGTPKWMVYDGKPY